VVEYVYMRRRKSVTLTEAEYRALLKARQYVGSHTGYDISFGALVYILSCGVVAIDRASNMPMAGPNGSPRLPFTVLPGRVSAGPPGPHPASGKGQGASVPSRP
jgi:hypothetical protein